MNTCTHGLRAAWCKLCLDSRGKPVQIYLPKEAKPKVKKSNNRTFEPYMRVRSGKQWRAMDQGIAQTSAFASLVQHGLRSRLDKLAVLETDGRRTRSGFDKLIIGREDNIAAPI